ncbi:MAG TPA: phosphate ABC transporter substrate-binding protein PstS [Candidatus Acidoferrum sp.]|nr:phosphate ABC transporter substrate-binding protein PstS [Candidatus Acidoferrum sp.]
MNRRAQLCARLSSFLVATLLSGIFPTGQAQTSTTLVATGSSLPEPLYVAWGEAYHAQHPETQLRYIPEGTADSARKVLGGVGDWGGGDAPIPENSLKSAAVPVLELPTVLIGIAVVYNLPNTPGDLRLSGPVLADIFLGKTKSWNDPAIAKLNPAMKLPAQPIQVIHRADGKGANYILSDFLCKVSPEFLVKAGRGESPKWPIGLSTARSQDMTDKVRATQWSIGYTESNLAQMASLKMARVKNPAGEFVLPTTKSISTAALGAKMRGDFRVSLTNAPGRDSYPVTSFTWLYIPAKSKNPERGRAVTAYLRWVYGEGQKIAQERGYATLPNELLAKVTASVAGVR